ncbi:MAG: hypothetical protein CMP23_13745 [Rickettsiales bacterium]|nr:hypothetical protein [Rickettsiales bacterium]
MITPFLRRTQGSIYTPAVMRRISFKIIISVLALCAVSLIAQVVLVESANAQRKKVVFGEEEEGSVVEGYVHKPEVGYIITRQEQEDLETLQLKENLAPKIVRSVNKHPF